MSEAGSPGEALIDASYAAFNRGDLETLLTLYTEDCVWDLTRFPDSGVGLAKVWTGHEDQIVAVISYCDPEDACRDAGLEAVPAP